MRARAIVLGLNYGPDRDPLEILAHKDLGAISAYALGDDYHDVVKKKLKAVAGFIFEKSGAEVKVFVDTAPVMEKPLAQKAGLGWQGKHTNLVSREFGSWLFLGSIFTTLELPPDEGESDHCGNCRQCLDICPTDAFPAPYRLDARRCISYLTIENKGPIPREFRAAMGNRIYGCDDCLAVCPWNKFAQERAGNETSAARGIGSAARWRNWRGWTMRRFRALFRKSPVKRIGRDRFLRNVLIAIGNSGDAALAAASPCAAGRSLASGARRGGVGAAAPAAGNRIHRPRPRIRAFRNRRLRARGMERYLFSAAARPAAPSRLRAASAVSPPPAILSAA